MGKPYNANDPTSDGWTNVKSGDYAALSFPSVETGGTGSGNTILNGSGAPSSGTGVNGDFYIDTTNNRLYGPKAAGAWPGSYVSLVGPQGTQGTQGATGSQGATGATGPAGPGATDTPALHGMVEWNYDPIATGSGSGQVCTSGTIYLMKVTAQTGGTVSNIVAVVGTAGATLTSGQNLAGIYDSSGTRLGVTSDQTTAWGSTGVKTMALTASVTLTAGQTYYVALLSVGTTPASFVRGGSTGITSPNVLLSASALRFCTNGTSQTALPSSVTLSSNAGAGGQTFWVGLS